MEGRREDDAHLGSERGEGRALDVRRIGDDRREEAIAQGREEVALNQLDPGGELGR